MHLAEMTVPHFFVIFVVVDFKLAKIKHLLSLCKTSHSLLC